MVRFRLTSVCPFSISFHLSLLFHSFFFSLPPFFFSIRSRLFPGKSAVSEKLFEHWVHCAMVPRENAHKLSSLSLFLLLSPRYIRPLSFLPVSSFMIFHNVSRIALSRTKTKFGQSFFYTSSNIYTFFLSGKPVIVLFLVHR